MVSSTATRTLGHDMSNATSSAGARTHMVAQEWAGQANGRGVGKGGPAVT